MSLGFVSFVTLLTIIVFIGLLFAVALFEEEKSAWISVVLLFVIAACFSIFAAMLLHADGIL